MNIILVTGGNGLVGNALKNRQHSFPNYQFVFLKSADCDLTQFDDTIKLFKKIKPTYIIHLAAHVGGLFKNMNYKVDMLEKNILINMNVLKAAHHVKVKKLIACLSTCIFPNDITYPIDETMLHEGPPHESNYAYAYAKRLLEIHIKTYQEQYGDAFICIIPTNIYGPADNYHLEDAHVIPALIHKCYLAKQNNQPFVVAGTGQPLRQFIYSEDLAVLIMMVLEKYHQTDSIILSVGEEDEVSIDTVARLIAKQFEYEDKLKYDLSLSDGQYKKTADNKKMIHELGEFKFTQLEVGIKQSVDWFVNNYKTCRK